MATTTFTDDSDELLIDPGDQSWMSSLPELSTLDYSPQSTAAGITFGPHAGKQMQAAMASSAGNDNAAADFNENDVAQSPPAQND